MCSPQTTPCQLGLIGMNQGRQVNTCLAFLVNLHHFIPKEEQITLWSPQRKAYFSSWGPFFPACSWEMLPFSSQYLQYIRILRGRIRTWSASCLRQDKLETNPSVLTAFYEYKTGVSERRNRSINSTEFKNQCIIFSIMQRLDYITYIHTHIQFLKPLQEIREKLSRAYGNLTVCS